MLTSVRKLFKNTLFRLSLLGAILFVVSMFVSLGYVYFATISSELRRVDKSIITAGPQAFNFLVNFAQCG